MSGAGKGPEWRKGADLKKYYTNFPVLSGEHISKAKKIVKKKTKN